MEEQMREIKFRGQTKLIVGTYNLGKEDGEWVKGCLYHDVGKWVIRQFEYERADYVGYEVDPDTIGQYIGINDKNEKEIYEKDIVLIDGEDEYFVVEWDNDTARFVMNSETLTVDFNNYYGYQVEVVGNVYDNADLLEGNCKTL